MVLVLSFALSEGFRKGIERGDGGQVSRTMVGAFGNVGKPVRSILGLLDVGMVGNAVKGHVKMPCTLHITLGPEGNEHMQVMLSRLVLLSSRGKLLNSLELSLKSWIEDRPKNRTLRVGEGILLAL